MKRSTFVKSLFALSLGAGLQLSRTYTYKNVLLEKEWKHLRPWKDKTEVLGLIDHKVPETAMWPSVGKVFNFRETEEGLFADIQSAVSLKGRYPSLGVNVRDVFKDGDMGKYMGIKGYIDNVGFCKKPNVDPTIKPIA